MNPGFHTYKLESWVIIDGGGFLSEKYVETLIWVWEHGFGLAFLSSLLSG